MSRGSVGETNEPKFHSVDVPTGLPELSAGSGMGEFQTVIIIDNKRFYLTKIEVNYRGQPREFVSIEDHKLRTLVDGPLIPRVEIEDNPDVGVVNLYFVDSNGKALVVTYEDFYKMWDDQSPKFKFVEKEKS